MKELIEIQNRLKAPKGNEAKGSNGRIIYRYRSCEDILESVKGLLKEQKCTIIITDDVVLVANRIYIKATATITNDGGESVSASAFAREPDTMAAMNASQVTGAASSYARKYALNGLLAIDDTKDADALNATPQYTQQSAQQEYSPREIIEAYVKPAIEQARTAEELKRIYDDYAALQTNSDFLSALSARRKALGIKNSNEK